MSTAPIAYRKWIQPKRWARNAMTPDAYFARQIRDGMNHVTAYRGKTFAQWGWLDQFPSSATSYVAWRFRGITGHGAKKMAFRLGLAPGLRTGGADPRVTIAVTEVGVGTVSTDVRHGLNVTGGNDAPGSIHWTTTLFDVTPETTYEVAISTVDEGVPLCGVAYEVGETDISESTEWMVTAPPTVATPVYDSSRARMLQGLSEMWLSKRPQLITWAGNGLGTAVTQNSTTWKNVHDAATTISASTAGYMFDSAADMSSLMFLSRRKEEATVKCVLAAYAKTSAGSGGEIRLANAAGAHATLGSIGTAEQWYSADVDIDVEQFDKLDLQVRNTAADTTSVYAVSLYVRAA